MKKIALAILGVGILLSGAAGASFKTNNIQASAYVQQAESNKPKELKSLKREYKKLTEDEKKKLKEKFNSLSEEEKRELKKLRENFKNEKDPVKRNELKEKFREYKNKVLGDN